MTLTNTSTRYGVVTKTLHWLIFIGIVMQYFVASIMLNIKDAETFWGITQGPYYNWHKSVGLIIFGLVICRYLWRRLGGLPDWSPGLTAGDQRYIHRVEQVLYACMFVMPISGYLFVMAGGYGVNFFGMHELPRPIGKIEWLSKTAEYIHIATALVLFVAFLAHMGMVFRRTLVHRDGYVRRMLPFTHQR